jgi:precorrin-3B methylase
VDGHTVPREITKRAEQIISNDYVLAGYNLFLSFINPLTPNDLKRRRAVNPLKIKIPCQNMREKPTNTPIIHSVY